MSDKVNKFKVGDEVEIVSLTNTRKAYGISEEMLNVGDRSFVVLCGGDVVLLKDDIFSYHTKDFKLIKSVDEKTDTDNKEETKETWQMTKEEFKNFAFLKVKQRIGGHQ